MESRQGAAAGIPAGRTATWAGGRRRARRCRTLHIVLTAEPKGSEDTSDAAREGGAGEESKSISDSYRLREQPRSGRTQDARSREAGCEGGGPSLYHCREEA